MAGVWPQDEQITSHHLSLSVMVRAIGICSWPHLLLLLPAHHITPRAALSTWNHSHVSPTVMFHRSSTFVQGFKGGITIGMNNFTFYKSRILGLVIVITLTLALVICTIGPQPLFEAESVVFLFISKSHL